MPNCGTSSRRAPSATTTARARRAVGFWFTTSQFEVSWYLHAYGSRWLPRRLFDDAPDALADALFEASRHWPFQLHLNKALSGAAPEAVARDRGTAINPTVFDAAVLALTASWQQYAFTSSAILGGEALARLLHVTTDWGIVICDAITLIMAWIGYDLIHRYDRWASVLFAAVFLAITVKMLTVTRPAYHGHADTAANILLAISVFVSWQITWAPYVSDYSRYLPQQTPSSRTFWYTYAGSAIGAVWFMIIGAYGGILAPAAISSNTAGYFAGLFPAVQWLILLTAVLGIFAANVENLYGPFLSGAAAVSPSGRIGSAPVARFVAAAAVAILGTLLAILASPHFLTDLSNFVLFLLYFMIPWTAINLTDYYVVRRGRYDIEDFFRTDGQYGRVNWRGVGIYVVTIGVEIPFINTSLYVGPIATDLDGADISWIVGFIVAAVLYYLAARRRQPTASEPVTAPATSR